MHMVDPAFSTRAETVAVQAEEVARHAFHRDHILGTSMDMVVTGGDQAQAQIALDAALREIDRLDRILSGWRSDSELARLNRSNNAFAVSGDLFFVIAQCEAWRAACGGAFSSRIGQADLIWREAGRLDRAPDLTHLRAISLAAETAEVRLDPVAMTIDRAGVVFAVDALAKGYIIDSALGAARAASGAQGVMLDIGGDLRCEGASPSAGGWRVGLGCRGDADNLAPSQAVSIRSGAVATSGAGARDQRIGGRDFGHTLVPTSGEPAHGGSVTVMAPLAADADALATALGVLPACEGLNLAVSAGAEARIVDADGAVHRTPGWGGLLIPAVLNGSRGAPPLVLAAAPKPAPNRAWPAGYAVEVDYQIEDAPYAGGRAPFVVIWITDSAGKLVRTLYHLGTHPKQYLHSNYMWWFKMEQSGRTDRLDSVTRTSRWPGRYTAVWDGKDDNGIAVPQGRYTVNVEMTLERAGHSLQRIPMTLGAAPLVVTGQPDQDLGAATVRYGLSNRKDDAR